MTNADKTDSPNTNKFQESTARYYPSKGKAKITREQENLLEIEDDKIFAGEREQSTQVGETSKENISTTDQRYKEITRSLEG